MSDNTPSSCSFVISKLVTTEMTRCYVAGFAAAYDVIAITRIATALLPLALTCCVTIDLMLC